MTWTDIHSHILPGFDDGASGKEEFIEMARIAVGSGTSTMFATPHYDHENPAFEQGEMVAAVRKYGKLLKNNGIPLEVLPGLEIRVNGGLLELVSMEEVNGYTLGEKGEYMLVEFPMPDVPLSTLEIFFEIQLRGITPVLAHPERNMHLQSNPAEIRKFVERGIAVQVNAGSLTGLFGKKARRIARQLIKEDVATFVASDAHSTRGRSPNLSGAADALRKLLGDDAPGLFLDSNPATIL